MEKHQAELAAIEALDNGEPIAQVLVVVVTDRLFAGKTFTWAYGTDVDFAIQVFKYFAGWADKITGQTIEVRFNHIEGTVVLTYHRLTSGNLLTLDTNPLVLWGKSSHGTSLVSSALSIQKLCLMA